MIKRPATGRSSSQFCGRPHPRLSPIHCRPGLQLPLLLGDASGLISQRKSPGLGIQGLLAICGLSQCSSLHSSWMNRTAPPSPQWSSRFLNRPVTGRSPVVVRGLTLSKTQTHEIFFWQILRIKFSPNYLCLDNTTPRNGKRAESGKSLCST